MTSDLTQDRGRSTAKTCTRQRLANRVRVAAMFAAICNASVTNKPHNSISTEYKPKWICFNAANLWKSIPHSAFAYLALSLPDNFSRVTNGISVITINFWLLRQEIFLPKTINKKEGNTMYNHLFSHRKSMQHLELAWEMPRPSGSWHLIKKIKRLWVILPSFKFTVLVGRQKGIQSVKFCATYPPRLNVATGKHRKRGTTS